MSQPVCAIVGAGEGLGRALAAKFAGEGFDIALISRSETGSRAARVRIARIDLDVGEGMTCEFSIMDDDPLSASVVWNWHSVRRRAGWDIEIRTTTRLSATTTEFLIDTDVEALEDSKAVFSRSWNERLPRDGV